VSLECREGHDLPKFRCFILHVASDNFLGGRRGEQGYFRGEEKSWGQLSQGPPSVASCLWFTVFHTREPAYPCVYDHSTCHTEPAECV